MPVGTIALTNNSPNVVGTGTTFNNDLKVNDYIVVVVGQIAYQVAVKSVNSNTSATLVLNYDGPTASGLAWNPVSPATLGVLSQSAAADTARAFRQHQRWAENWQKLLTTNGPVTINNPDGSSTNGIGWPALDASKANKTDLDALALRTGTIETRTAALGSNTPPNGATNANDILTTGFFTGAGDSGTNYYTPYNGLLCFMRGEPRGSQIQTDLANGRIASRTRNNSLWGNWMTPLYAGDFGIGTPAVNTPADFSAAFISSANSNGWAPAGGAGLQSSYANSRCSQLWIDTAQRLHVRFNMSSSPLASLATSPWVTMWGAGNTTVDASGFIKRASPVVKIFADGQSELNDESEGVIVTRESAGVYRIKNVFGLNSDAGWGGIDGGFDVPQDRNKQPLIWLDYSVDADGSVIVKTFHRTHPNAPAFARNIIDGIEEGEPIDIPADQFVSVRVQMPEDSAWNIKQREILDSLEQEPSS